VDTCVIMSYLLGQYSPYTFTVALLDITDPTSLLTTHLYMYCPTAVLLLVVYDGLLATVVHLLLDLSSQEYISIPSPSALHVRVAVLLNGMVTSFGCVVIDGGPEKYNNTRTNNNIVRDRSCSDGCFNPAYKDHK